MSLKSLIRKASVTLGSILLACNIGCNSLNNYKNYLIPDDLEQEVEPIKQESKPFSFKRSTIPLNILGGYLTHIGVHESGHAMVGLLQGLEIEEYRPYPGKLKIDADHSEFHGGWVSWKPVDINELPSPQERAFRAIAGPLADITLAEVTNYRLRKGHIPKQNQPFWATTSLMARAGPIFIALGSLNDEKAVNDFSNVEKNTEISKDTLIGLTTLYTVLSAKRIAKEFRVATGQEFYKHEPGKKGDIYLIPHPNGLGVCYSLNF